MANRREDRYATASEAAEVLRTLGGEDECDVSCRVVPSFVTCFLRGCRCGPPGPPPRRRPCRSGGRRETTSATSYSLSTRRLPVSRDSSSATIGGVALEQVGHPQQQVAALRRRACRGQGPVAEGGVGRRRSRPRCPPAPPRRPRRPGRRRRGSGSRGARPHGRSPTVRRRTAPPRPAPLSGQVVAPSTTGCLARNRSSLLRMLGATRRVKDQRRGVTTR